MARNVRPIRQEGIAFFAGLRGKSLLLLDILDEPRIVWHTPGIGDPPTIGGGESGFYLPVDAGQLERWHYRMSIC